MRADAPGTTAAGTEEGGAAGSAGGAARSGPGWHVVEQGEGIESIAHRAGLFWQTVWNHPENAGLRSRRQMPNVLLPGDRVFVPQKRRKDEAGGTEKKHRFRRKGVPDRLEVIVRREGEPRSGVPYVIDVDGTVTRGTTDGEGRIRFPIPPAARTARLIVGEPPDVEETVLALGGLDPPAEPSGARARLANLGYDVGPLEGVLGPGARGSGSAELPAELAAALRRFQADAGLQETGQIDQATADELAKRHGS